MRISDWSSDVCSSDLSSSTESSGTATLRIPNSKTSANLTTRNRIANFSPGSTARSKKRPPNSPNPHKEYRRSEEHTSELQSLMRISYAVFCLKKKKKAKTIRRVAQQQHRAAQVKQQTPTLS